MYQYHLLYEVVIFKPKNISFLKYESWRQSIDMLCQGRFYSVTFKDKHLLYLIDDHEIYYKFIKQLKKLYPNLKLYTNQIKQTY